jgi:hypothetical protein
MSRLHQLRKKLENFERHAEDEDLVAVFVPEIEQFAEYLFSREKVSLVRVFRRYEQRTFHLPQS